MASPVALKRMLLTFSVFKNATKKKFWYFGIDGSVYHIISLGAQVPPGAGFQEASGSFTLLAVQKAVSPGISSSQNPSM